ncbi:MAG: hypothetical protein L3J88_13110 [Gammaproteobacteria bacterium]|nr:hypothetical protein [Gammaproteobacteria bacterium]MCF6364254.1 hypothetical protein [Gammaproteobacteria bacterium]
MKYHIFMALTATCSIQFVDPVHAEKDPLERSLAEKYRQDYAGGKNNN